MLFTGLLCGIQNILHFVYGKNKGAAWLPVCTFGTSDLHLMLMQALSFYGANICCHRKTVKTFVGVA